MEWKSIPISVVIVGFLLWLSRNIIKDFLTNSIKHDYDIKLAELKSKLKAQEEETSLLRNGALDGIVNRQIEIYKHQINAVTIMWNAIIDFKKMKGISATKHSIPYKEISKEANTDPKIQEFLNMVISEFNIADDLNIDPVNKVRPYLSPLSWAYFSAYHSILFHDALEISLQKLGSDDILRDSQNDHLANIVKLVLPHHTDYIEKYKNTSLYTLLDELEKNLLEELTNILDGKTNDSETIKRAAKILEESNKLKEHKK